ncbi:hypothetical protein SAMN05428945_2596 [Streptomyces sp. 2224.1]|uniref:hypothetical protein n=1 Tax=unclassified Streptomyces TaxID=2593676 RepID=UPI000881CAE0|nr:MULTISPECIES: hypothetical protein [unclassified Streptomyces]PBC82808.1 hypothetical protein BX261_2720 [Streptomyces sp. 2321.6]SDR47005.1 hypothetical protein SAMN05216511_4482 [Streptomyces sp. KS_16]SEC32288.1 hypothetical protein SAMN05428945_2596 [Streptomyces sp. 2224.1]SEC72576.1 hypothetical protein SAMN05428940_2724 [Streptomyces sp. 2133.1]SEE91881.1 hypothetical protein SAMN05428954_4520 [Streptomyces sp. 2112.3]
MAMIRTTGARRGVLPMTVLSVLGVLAAGCGTHRPEGNAGAAGPSRAAAATPSRPADFPCPGESPAPTPATHSSGRTAPPTDHYAENHGFRVPFPLHGRRRCDGLAAVRRIERALEPLRRRGDFDPVSTRSALTGLGYSAGKVQSHQNGPAAVSFLIDASPLCLEGTMNSRTTQADAFGGYPDHPGCDAPSGGH